MPYLLIENQVKEMPSIEAIRMLGASFSRGIETRIGQFGSGAPYAFALLARTPSPDGDKTLLESFKICLGTDVYTFYTTPTPMNDSEGSSHTTHEICMKKQGGGSWNLNIATSFGAIDWTDPTMAIREFISNAIDGADAFDGTNNSVRIDPSISDEPRACRAKDGYIRIYIKINDEIAEYIEELKRNFICLTPGYNPNQQIYHNSDGGPAKIYRKGVKVGEFGEHSAFHYNIADLNLKESRIVDSSEARDRCAKVIAIANVESLVTYVNNLLADAKIWERDFNTYWLNPSNNSRLTDDQKEAAQHNWMAAIDRTLAGTVICETDTAKAMVVGKGLTAWTPSFSVGGLLKKMGAVSSDKVLNLHEIEGKELCPATQNVLDTVNMVWDMIDRAGMTVGKEKPKVMGFHQNTVGPGSKAGYYVPGGDTIYIRSDFGDDRGVYLINTVIEESAHYITGAQDCTRDFQEFAFKFSAVLMTFLLK
jgi:hypothetical protein